MASIEKTVEDICSASTFDARIAEIRKIPGKHGTDDRPAIFAQVARELYVPDLTPDFAYIHQLDFYDEPHFQRSYEPPRERRALRLPMRQLSPPAYVNRRNPS